MITVFTLACLTLGSSVMNFIASDSVLLILFCGSLVALGCNVLGQIKRTAKK
jgi:hypothetical protein